MRQLLLLAALCLFGTAVQAARQAERLLQSSGLSGAAGDWEKSLTLATQAAAADPAQPRAFLQWAVAAERLGRHEEAAAAAGRALALGLRKPAVHLVRGEARLGLGDPQGALADADAALRLNPVSPESLALRARARQALGESPELSEGRRVPIRPKHPRRLGPLFLLVLVLVLGGALYRRRRRARPPALEGESLRQLLTRRGRLTPLTVLRVAESGVAGLAARKGRVAPETLLSDAPPPAAAALAAYWPPERESGEPPNPVGDLYSLAVCLYEALTGRLPFSGPEASVDKRLGRLAPPSGLVPGLPGGVDAFFLRALNPEPERRFQTPPELLNALRAAVAPTVE